MYACPLDSYSALATDYFRELCHKDNASIGRLSKWGVSVVASVALAVFATIDIGVYLKRSMHATIVFYFVPFVHVTHPPLIHLKKLVELLVTEAPLMFCANLFNYGYFPTTERSFQAAQAANRRAQEEAKVAEDRKQFVDNWQVEGNREFVGFLNQLDHQTQNRYQAALETIKSSGRLEPVIDLIHSSDPPFEGLISFIYDVFEAAKKFGFNYAKATLLEATAIGFRENEKRANHAKAYKTILLKLLELGAADPKIFKKREALVSVCIDDVELVEQLLKAGAPPNQGKAVLPVGKHKAAGTYQDPLYSAFVSTKPNLKVMTMLFHYGADPTEATFDQLDNLARMNRVHFPMLVPLDRFPSPEVFGGMPTVKYAAFIASRKVFLDGVKPGATVRELSVTAQIFRYYGYDPLTHLRILDDNGRPDFAHLTTAKMEFLEDLIERFDDLQAEGERKERVIELQVEECERKERAVEPKSLILARDCVRILRIKEAERKESRAQGLIKDNPLSIKDWLVSEVPSALLEPIYSYGSISDWVRSLEVFEREISSQEVWDQINIRARGLLSTIFGIRDYGSTSPLLCLFQNIYDRVYTAESSVNGALTALSGQDL